MLGHDVMGRKVADNDLNDSSNQNNGEIFGAERFLINRLRCDKGADETE